MGFFGFGKKKEASNQVDAQACTECGLLNPATFTKCQTCGGKLGDKGILVYDKNTFSDDGTHGIKNEPIIDKEKSIELCLKGKEFFKSRRSEMAEQCYDEAIRLDPENIDAWMAKAQVLSLDAYRDEKIMTEMIACYDEVIRLDPENPEPWSWKGSTYFTNEDYEKAIRCYDELTRLDPENPTPFERLGDILQKLGKDEEAKTCFAKAKVLEEDNDKFEDEIQSEIEEKIKPKHDFGESNEDRATNWSIEGRELEKQGRYKRALVCYNESIRLDPENSNKWSGKAILLSKLKRYVEAIRCYDEAIRLDPENSNEWSLKGFSLQKLGKHEEAEQCFAKAKELEEE